MAEPANTEASDSTPTFFGLIATHGRMPADEIVPAVHLAAGAELDRRRPSRSLTRSTVLWAILHLDHEIADALRDSGVTEADLARSLGLASVPSAADINDIELHGDLCRALAAGLGGLGLRTITLSRIDLADAILVDAEAHSGRLGRHLDDVGADVRSAIRRIRTLRDRRAAAQSSGPERSSSGTKAIEPPALTEAARLYIAFYEALKDPEELAADPAGIDRSAVWQGFVLVASRRDGTLATVVKTTLERRRNVRRGSRSGQGPADGLEVFGIERVEPLMVVGGPELTSHPLIVRAAGIRDQIDPEPAIRLRHLIAAAIEIGRWPSWAGTGSEVTTAVRDAVVDQLERDAPSSVAARWRAYYDARPTAAGPVGRAIAGVDVDLVDDRTALSDELGVAGDVATLCDMLAAKGAVAPISVGLFGRWGSGKSYFMALMRRRIDELRLAAKAAEESGQATSYCPEIVQVTFNAWHYMDADDLWATLAVQLFNAIGQVEADGEPGRSRADVVSELLERKQQMATVDRKITEVLRDPRVDAAAQRTGLASTREEALGLLGEVGTAVGYVAAAKAWWARWRGAAVAVTVASLSLAVLTALVVSGTIRVEWLLALVPFAGSATVWLRRIKDGLAQLNEIAASSGLDPRDLTAERIADDSRVLELLDELEAIDRVAGIRDWVRERALSADYTSHFGVISVLRGDLEALVEKQQNDAPHRRIVLYVDDLDRCEPARVVEVLQAVHLLLAFPLFVVVVGVDPRWLLRSLEGHYRQVLSTPHDYLEKIFQIPFSLRPMASDGYGRLVASLAGATTPRPTTAAVPDATGAGAAVSQDIDDFATVVDDFDGEAIEQHQEPEPSPPPPDPDPAPVVPNPPQLQMTDDEVAALARVGPLIGTPRAAKRLVNLYRLIRAGLDDAAVERFVDDAEFRSLAIVLAVQVGWAGVATAFLGELAGTGTVTVTERLDALPAPDEGDDTAALSAALRAVCTGGFDRPVSELQRWLPRLRRYSFEGALDPAPVTPVAVTRVQPGSLAEGEP